MMSDQITQLRIEAEAAISAASDERELEEIRVAYLGRNGSLNLLRKSIGKLPQDERPAFGAAINTAADAVERMLTRQKAALAEGSRVHFASTAVTVSAPGSAAGEEVPDTLDVTLPGRAPRIGKQHPLLATMEDMIAIFLGLGFTVAEGPEVENYHYSFEALNYPEYHPAMDEQMTFYISDRVLLRSQTSTVQIRTMEHQQPPVR